MARRGYTAEQVIGIIRESEVRLGHGRKTGQINGIVSDPDSEPIRYKKALKISNLALHHTRSEMQPLQAFEHGPGYR